MKDLFGRTGKRPTCAADTAVFSVQKGLLCILLIERGSGPYTGSWALPGGFMEWGESCEQNAARELQEETGLKGLRLEHLGVFSKPGRDPRGTIVAVEFIALAGPRHHKVKGADDAARAAFVPVNKRPKLAFDHEDVLKAAIARLKQKLNDKKWLAPLLSKDFTIAKLKAQLKKY